MDTLYAMTGDYLALADMLFDPEVSQEDVLLAMGRINDDLRVKLLNMARLVKSVEAKDKAVKEEEERLASRRKAMANKAARLKELMQQTMEMTGNLKVEDDLFTLAIQNSPPSVHVLDERAIPEEYLLPQPPTLDKKHILEVLKRGEGVPGAQLHQGTHLRIR